MGGFETKLYEGGILRKLVMFSFPFLVSNIIQSLYNVADMLIVGNFCGSASMAGVNIGGQITFILTNTVVGLCMGGTVLISQYIGANNREGMKKATATLFTILLAAALVITVVMLVFKQPVLRLIQTPPEAMQESNRYLTCTVLGTVFIFGYNMLAAVMRAMGDSKRPLYFVSLACVTNISLDLLFVGAFGLRAFGAALATVISQALSMILCVAYMIHNGFVFDFRLSSFKVYKDQLAPIIKIGLPSMVQNGVSSLSFLFITAMANIIGVSATAAVGAVGKFNGFAIMPAVALGASISTISAQNIGAGQWSRAIKSCRYGVMMALSISALMFAVTQAFPGQILRLFGNDQAMIEAGVAYMRNFSIDYWFVPFVFCINGMFIGAGHTTFSLITSLLSSLLLRVPMSYLLGVTMHKGLPGLGLAAPMATAGSLLIILAYLFSGKWRVNAVTKTAGAVPPDFL